MEDLRDVRRQRDTRRQRSQGCTIGYGVAQGGNRLINESTVPAQQRQLLAGQIALQIDGGSSGRIRVFHKGVLGGNTLQLGAGAGQHARDLFVGRRNPC